MGRGSARSIVAAVGVGLALLSGCSEVVTGPGEDGDLGTWELADPAAVTASSRQVTLAVTRLGCASGYTGKVLQPKVTYEPERIVIQADVERLAGDGVQTCQGNPAVRITLGLSEPIGERQLVDGMCLLDREPHVVMCDDPVRWPKP